MGPVCQAYLTFMRVCCFGRLSHVLPCCFHGSRSVFQVFCTAFADLMSSFLVVLRFTGFTEFICGLKVGCYDVVPWSTA